MLIQYLSLNWPTENDWWWPTAALQLIAYFNTVFVAVPVGPDHRSREIGGGYGRYNQDHEFFGYPQSI